jgi:glycosyltransferase 2 family protein
VLSDLPLTEDGRAQSLAVPRARAGAAYYRYLKPAFLIGGLALTGWIVAEVGAPSVGATLKAAGWVGLLTVSGVHLVGTALLGWAWWVLGRGGAQWIFMWGRLVRDAGSEVLPFSQIGGYLLGARAITLHGVAAAAAIASTVVDMALEFCAQIAFTAFGVALLVWFFPRSQLIAPVFAGLGVAIAAAYAFIAVQKRGEDFFTRRLARLTGRRLSGLTAVASAVQFEIRQIHCWKYRLWGSFLLHVGAWFIAAVEGWIALRFMGARISLPTVLIIETLLFSTRAVAFMMPSGLGVQEGAYIVLGAAFGLTPDLALGLSLLKRGRDFLLGIPSLASWQWFENRKQPSSEQIRRDADN